MEQVIDPQTTPGHLVFIRRANALAGGTNFLVAGLGRFPCLVDGRVIGQDQRATRADLEARANVDTAFFQFCNLGDQVMDVEHHAIADIAVDTFAHDPGRDQIELIDVIADNECMTGVVPALETDDTLGVVRQPVDNLAFPFVAPLRAHNDDILGHVFQSSRIASISH